MADTERIHKRIDDVEGRLDSLRTKGVETRSLRSCLGLARLWLTDGSNAHAESICEEIVNVAERLSGEELKPPGEPQQASDLTPLSNRLVELEQRLREHFGREIGQALAAKPWRREAPKQEPTTDPVLKDQVELLRAQVEEVRKLNQEGAGASLEEVKSMIAAELEANGLESKLNRRALPEGAEPPVPRFVERLDGRLMQLARAQDRLTERLLSLERTISEAFNQLTTGRRLNPAEAAAPTTRVVADAEPTGSWLNDLEHIGTSAPVAPTEPTRQAPAPDSKASKPAVFSSDDDPATLSMQRLPEPGTGANTPAAAVPAPRDDDERIRGMIAAEMARHQRPTDSYAQPAEAAAMSDADLAARLVALLPEVLRRPAVREAVLAVVAVEAATNPGALAELSGVRAFLRRELLRQVDELKKALAVGEPV